MKRLMILPLLLVMLVSLSANAKGWGIRDWQWWQNESIVTELNLSEDQVTKTNEISTKFDPILKEVNENYIEKLTAFRDAQSNPDDGRGDVIKSFDSTWDSKYKMKRIKLDRDLDMKEVLTPEQVTKLGEIRKEQKEEVMRKHHKMMHKKSYKKKN